MYKSQKTDYNIDEIERLINLGWSLRKIAKEVYNVDPPNLTTYLKRNYERVIAQKEIIRYVKK